MNLGLGKMQKLKTLGELKKSQYQSVSIKDEMRANLLRKLAAGEAIFPGIVGFEDTVTPQIVNAILSKHNFILLGLRGQAKSRILRSLGLAAGCGVPIIAGCEINDDPLHPLCRACHERIEGDGRRDAHRLSASPSSGTLRSWRRRT